MSKFDELCNAYRDLRSEYSAVRSDAIDFSSLLVVEYLRYLNLDSSSTTYKLYPLEGEIKANSTYTPFGATHLGNDGYWHLGFALTVYTEPNTYPKQPFTIHFRYIRNEDGSHQLGVVDLGPDHKISAEGNQGDFDVVFNMIQQNILEYFTHSTDFLKGKERKFPSIGFIQGSLASNLDGDLKA